YAVKAQARDSLGLESAWSGAKTVTISPNPQNQAPAVNAGSDQTANAAATVPLSGTGTDPENGALTYQWRQTGGTPVTLSNPTSARASFAAPGIATGTATLTFELRVTDAAGLSAVDTLTVVVQSPDIDGDKVPNSQDAFPTNPAEWKDSNGNGIGDNADAAAAAAKQAPDAPLLVSPVNNAMVGIKAILKTGSFRTGVAGTAHAKSRWQVFRDEDAACVLDIQSSAALTSLTVPNLVLDEATPYFWRVQFIDSKGAASAWSDYEDFVTSKTSADLNANGIPDAQEVAATVDLDRDGVKDNSQPRYIKSVKMEGTSVQLGVSIKGCTTCLGVESVESEDVSQPDSYAYGKPTRMPFGLINFKIAVAKPGDTAVLKLYFSKAASYFSKWYKYDPVADKWYDFSAYAKFARDRRSVTLTLKDGGPGDADGIANGVIVDPAGVVEADEEPVMNRVRPRALRQGSRRE
ncbi:MAG TPA: choice-of-anchor U domain-containing protein, partial [Desulfobacterales bacterium]|nr:choice-of-anchor U domain-containing protein [Desulfobacterales bacterium]